MGYWQVNCDKYYKNIILLICIVSIIKDKDNKWKITEHYYMCYIFVKKIHQDWYGLKVNLSKNKSFVDVSEMLYLFWN